eukprot:3445497-Alexandrium_andersonii.AAC.1
MPRQRCLREAWRAATWSEWCLRGHRREALIARTVHAEWQAAPGEAIRKMIDNTAIGQHVLAIVTGATFSEARLEVRKRMGEKQRRKRKRDIDASLLCQAAGDDSCSEDDEADEPASDTDPDLSNCGCGVPEPPTLRHLFWRCTYHGHLRATYAVDAPWGDPLALRIGWPSVVPPGGWTRRRLA